MIRFYRYLPYNMLVDDDIAATETNFLDFVGVCLSPKTSLLNWRHLLRFTQTRLFIDSKEVPDADPMLVPCFAIQDLSRYDSLEKAEWDITDAVRRDVAQRMGFSYSVEAYAKARVFMKLQANSRAYEEELNVSQ